MEESTTEIVVLVTASSTDEAERLASLVVSSSTGACANIVNGVQSIFRWDNKLNTENECLMIIKTTMDRFSELETLIRTHHSYSVPEIIALPIVRGSEQYLKWIRSETHK